MSAQHLQRGFIVAVPEEINGVPSLKGYPVHYCGVGKINAALGATELIQQGCQEVINIGSCGSLHHSVGEVLKVGTVYQDIDATPLSPYMHTPFEEADPCITLDENSAVSCFTTDYFFDHSQSSKYSPSYRNSIQEYSIIDMELYAIAKVCRIKGVRCLAYKWVSDNGSFSHWQENCKLSLEKLLPLFKFD